MLPPLPAPNTQAVRVMVGPEGGTVAHPTGATLEVPAGALIDAVELSITGLAAPDEEALGASALGQAFVLGPEGQEFLRPLTVRVPFDATRLPEGTSADDAIVLIAPDHSDDFAALETTTSLEGGYLEVQTAHFSVVVPVAPTQANPLRISTKGALPEATAGSAYGPVRLEVSGGAAPVSWAVTRGALPTGLALSSAGVLSGTADAPGASTFTLRVSDAAGYKLEKAFSLTVLAPPAHPLPTLTSMAPSAAAQGSANTALVLSGASFVPGAQVYFGDLPLSESSLRSATRIDAVIPAALLAEAGSFPVRVVNPPPGGGSSEPLTFVVEPGPANPLPSVSSVDTDFIEVGASDTQISVSGSSFINGSQVVLGGAGGQAITTSFVSASELTAVVPASFLATAGKLTVYVFNPAPGGGYSLAGDSIVVGSGHPVPSLSSLEPNTAVAGRSRMLLTLHGDGFVEGAKVFFEDVALGATVTSAGLASTTLPSNLLETAGTFSVRIVNPAPGGGSSQELSFVVSEPEGVDGGGGDAGSEPPALDGSVRDGGDGALDAAVEDAGNAGDASTQDGGGEPALDAGAQSDASVSSEPVELVDGYELEVLAIDASYLYFKGGEAGIRRLPLAGGQAETVPGFTGYYSGKLQLVGDYLYYTNGVDTLLRRSITSGNEEVVTTTTGFSLLSWKVVGDLAYVHYSNKFDAVPVTGGARSPVLSSGAGGIIDADAKYIMFSVFANAAQNLWMTRVSGTNTALLLPATNAQGLLEGGVFYYSGGAGIYRVDLSSGASSNTLVAAGSAYVASMQLAGSDIYYVEGSELKVVPKAGGTPETLASAGNGRVVVDAGHVYFSSMYPDPGIFRMAR